MERTQLSRPASPFAVLAAMVWSAMDSDGNCEWSHFMSNHLCDDYRGTVPVSTLDIPNLSLPCSASVNNYRVLECNSARFSTLAGHFGVVRHRLATFTTADETILVRFTGLKSRMIATFGGNDSGKSRRSFGMFQ
jgi:hypothetical protein